jgi:renalase
MSQLPGRSPLAADVLIIGAGMCGLTIAGELLKASHNSYLIVDKGRSVGGRMATRRLDGQKFDHGAQFFTARSELFKQNVAEWIRDKAVVEWNKGFRQTFEQHAGSTPFQDGHPRYIGHGGMNQIAKFLAEKIRSDRILLGEKIIKIDLTREAVHLTSESGLELIGNSLVITTPAPQILDLIKSMRASSTLDTLAKELDQVQYAPCIALIGFFDMNELPLDEVPIQSAGSNISFLADNFSKGIATEKGALTVHLSGETSRQLFDADDHSIVNFVRDELKKSFKLQVVSAPRSFSIQRWRYASPTTTSNSPFLEWKNPDPSGPKIYCAGEAFCGPKIEGAFRSGYAVAQRMVSFR